MKDKGLLFVVSAPSGAGKTTICSRLMKSMDNIGFSVSHTTRKPRAGEADGRDYYFVSDETFADMVGSNDFVEWAEVHGNRYGTSRAELERLFGMGKDVLLDIDTQGAAQLRSSGIDGTFIIILPPDLNTLETRLRGRGTDPEDVIATRLANAIGELSRYKEYEFAIVNDDLDVAVGTLGSIITATKHQVRNMDPEAVKKALGI